MSSFRVVLSCEHGGNRVPARYANLFVGDDAQAALQSHRGWDIGALTVAKLLSVRLEAPLLYTTTTRLLIDANRSPAHTTLFSHWSATLDEAERDSIVERYHQPHWRRVDAALREVCEAHVVHLGIHSFTPELDGEVRNADVAFLYDPSRDLERDLCGGWQRDLARRSGLRVRKNYPYRGTSDGLTRMLRMQFEPSRYLGIEVEFNQALLLDLNARAKKILLTQFCEAFASAAARTFDRS